MSSRDSICSFAIHSNNPSRGDRLANKAKSQFAKSAIPTNNKITMFAEVNLPVKSSAKLLIPNDSLLNILFILQVAITESMQNFSLAKAF